MAHVCMYCRVVVEQYGLWDQIRVDQDKEWVLMLYIQETLAHIGTIPTVPGPHLQSMSKQVHYNNHIHLVGIRFIPLKNHTLECI